MRKLFIFILAAFAMFGARADKWDDLLKDVYDAISTPEFRQKIDGAAKETKDAYDEFLKNFDATTKEGGEQKSPDDSTQSQKDIFSERCNKSVEFRSLRNDEKEDLENKTFLSSTIYNDKVVYFFCKGRSFVRMATDTEVLDNECKSWGDGVHKNQLSQIGGSYIVCEGNKFIRNANDRDMRDLACKYRGDEAIHYDGAEYIQCRNGRYVGPAASPNFTVSDAASYMTKRIPHSKNDWNCQTTESPNKFICTATHTDGRKMTYEVMLFEKGRDGDISKSSFHLIELKNDEGAK